MDSSCITGDSVISSFKTDVEAFFRSNPAFELRIEKGGMVPTCRGAGSKARLCLPSDFFTQVIERPEDFIFLLLVLGHETAHYLNRHNEHNDKSHVESQGIEMWADFFGTKIAFVVLTFGAEPSSLLTSMPQTYMSRVDVFALALEKLAESYFLNTSNKYPERSARINTYVAGVMSFFEQYFKWSAIESNNLQDYARAFNPQVIVERSLNIQIRIYSNQRLKNWAMVNEGEELEKTDFETISAIHRNIQGKQDVLFKGMKPLPAIWLRLTYNISEPIRKKIVSDKLSLLKNTLSRLHNQ